jgi:hypothetical protein
VYVPTVASTITNYQPVLQTASSNTPRFDHDPVTGESKGLMIEPTRTNQFANSVIDPNDIFNGWQYNATTPIHNYAIAPDGTKTATYIHNLNGVRRHEVSPKQSNVTADERLSVSFYAKKVTSSRYLAVSPNAGGPQNLTIFDLQDGTSTYLGTDNLSAGIEDVGNGWYRCHVNWIANTTGTSACYISPGPAYTTNTVYTTTDGDIENGFLIWGAQQEYGSYPTSHIPTSGSTATRPIDIVAMADVPFINESEGTFVTTADFGNHSRPDASGADTRRHVISLRAGGINNGWFTMYQDENSFDILAYTGFNNNYNGVSNYNFNEVTAVGAYEISDGTINTYISVEGSAVSEDLNNDFPKSTDFTILDLGNGSNNTLRTLSGHLKRVAYYPKKLSNSEMQALSEE